jgi:5-methylcytosine-specific restriction endonuclease McrA
LNPEGRTIKSPCLESRCARFAEVRGRCREHYRELERERNQRRRADPKQGRAIKVRHSKRWLMLRKRDLFEQPICAAPGCTHLSRDVDHIVPMSRGGAEFERSNLQGLCSYHHALKSAREASRAQESA